MGNHRCSLLAIVPLLAGIPLLHAQKPRLPVPGITKNSVENFSRPLPIVNEPLHPWPRPVAPRRPIGTPGGVFNDVVRASGMIFSGTVTGIKPGPAKQTQAVATVAITFHIDHAIRGTRVGDHITISQWAGLWSSGQRYRLGERVLLFLYPRSKLGLTSCVAGPMGRFEVDAWGRVLLSVHHLSAFRTDPVLGGRLRLRLGDFALAVRQAGEEE
jgi:hypothetical protein